MSSPPPFSLDNHTVLAQLLTPLAFLAMLDISEAYTHIPMRPNLHRYLAFSYLGQLYFFRALPFGLNVAPYIFTQVLAWPLQCLQARGISLLAYLDNIVVWHRNRHTLLAQVHQVMVFLQDMGFRLNLEKSHPYPSPSAVLAGCPLVASDGPLASSSRGSRSDTSHGSGPPPGPSGHPLSEREVGGSNKLRVSGPPFPATLSPTTHDRQYYCQSSGQGQADSTPSSHARGLEILDISDPISRAALSGRMLHLTGGAPCYNRHSRDRECGCQRNATSISMSWSYGQSSVPFSSSTCATCLSAFLRMSRSGTPWWRATRGLCPSVRS